MTAHTVQTKQDQVDDQFEAELLRRRQQRQLELQAKLAEREERRKALEEKLAANKAVKFGQALFKTNKIFNGEHRDRHMKMIERQREQEARMREHKEKCKPMVEKVQEKIQTHNAQSDMTSQYFEEKAAIWKAEQERLKAEKAAKKIEDERKWTEYEQRKSVRRGSGDVAVPQKQAPPPRPVSPSASPKETVVVKSMPILAPVPVLEPASLVKPPSPKANKLSVEPRRSTQRKLNLSLMAPCVMNHCS